MDLTNREEFLKQAKYLEFDEREAKMLWSCIEYSEDPFGMPNHLLMVLVSKLWYLLEDIADKG